MPSDPAPSRKTPLGITLVSAFILLYSLLWILTGALASIAGNPFVVLLATTVVLAAGLLATGLYTWSRTAWILAVSAFGLATLWRLALVLDGHPDNLSNAAVGLLILLYLLSQHDHYRPAAPVEHS